MAFSVNGKSAIVTGAGSGINLSFAKLLVENGCNVLIADLGLRPEAQAFVDQRSSGSTRVVFQETNVTDWTQLERMFEVAEREFGEIDIVCPGAGVYELDWSSFWLPPGSATSKDSPSGGRYSVIDINLVHPIRTTQLAISHFLRVRENKPQKPKHILLISSIAAQNAWMTGPLYSATKHGITGFVRSLAKLDQQLGIRVTAVAPAIIKTPLWTDHPESAFMIDESKDVWVTPEEVATVMLALLQQDQVGEIIGDNSGSGTQFAVEGGTILEVAKTVRRVEKFNDPGPQDRPGTTISGYHFLEDQVFQILGQKDWGVSKP